MMPRRGWVLAIGPVRTALERLAASDRVLEGQFLPGGRSQEWCDAGVLRAIRRRSLAKLRQQVEPVEPAALGRFLVEWQGVSRPRAGLDSLLSAVEQLQGCPLPASALESEILPSRIRDYKPADLDLLCAQGEIVWRGVDPLAPADGRIALYLSDRYALLAPASTARAEGDLAGRVRALLGRARRDLLLRPRARDRRLPRRSRQRALGPRLGGGGDQRHARALRSWLRRSAARESRSSWRPFRSRRLGPPGTEGRWSLLPPAASGAGAPTETERRAALARALLERYGVLTREAVHAEGSPAAFPPSTKS
jgi:ATP-dependent Lhr-like helicase